MSRIRTIKPSFYTNEDLSKLPEVTHYGMAAGLLTYADDEGYFNANAGLIKAALFPLREPSVSIHEMLTQLESIEFLSVIDGPDGRKYGHIVNFLEHQRINRPTPSKIKKLLKRLGTSAMPHSQLSDESLPEGKGREGNKESKTMGASTDALLGFDGFWSAYPKKKSKGDAEKAWKRIKPDEHLQDRIHRALERAKTSAGWRKDGGKFIPYPASWLNAKGWEDEDGPRPASPDIYAKAASA